MEDQDQNPPKLSKIKLNKIKPSKKLHIITYNVRSLSSYERLLELSEALKEIKYDVIGLCEIRRAGNKIEEYENFILFHTGLNPGIYGIGFLVKKNLKNNIESYIGLTERVALLNMKFEDVQMSIIQVYAPTEKASEDEIEEFYQTINKAVKLAHKLYIVMGDLNAKIGHPKQEEYLITKPNGYGIRNTRGQRLIDFAIENKLAILNTYFKKKTKNKWTWLSPDGNYKNEIDFILSNRPHIFQNIDVLNINYPSDHRPVRATIMLQCLKKSRSQYKNQCAALKNEEKIIKYKECLVRHKSHYPLDLQKDPCIQTYYDNLVKIITKSLHAASTHKIGGIKSKIMSEKTLSLLKRRQELQKTKHKTRAMKNKLAALYKLASKYIKNDYINHRYNTIHKHLKLTGSTKKAYKELRTNKTWIDGLNRNGTRSYNRRDIISIATDFYKSLYRERAPSQDSVYYNNNPVMTNTNDIPRIEVSEVESTLQSLKTDKSPGPDHITNEALKTGSEMLVLQLTDLFNGIMKTGVTPSQWSESHIILLYKKGDSKDTKKLQTN